jgi:hypothetical protein
VGEAEGGTDGSTDITPETYNGSERGGQGFVSPQPLTDGTATFTAPSQLELNDHALVGSWKITPQYVQSAAAGASIAIRYQAGTANLVMATSTGQPIKVDVQIDGKPAGTVTVKDSDLYTLIADHSSGAHTMTLTPETVGLQAYAFTFGG